MSEPAAGRAARSRGPAAGRRGGAALPDQCGPAVGPSDGARLGGPALRGGRAGAARACTSTSARRRRICSSTRRRRSSTTWGGRPAAWRYDARLTAAGGTGARLPTGATRAPDAAAVAVPLERDGRPVTGEAVTCWPRAMTSAAHHRSKPISGRPLSPAPSADELWPGTQRTPLGKGDVVSNESLANLLEGGAALRAARRPGRERQRHGGGVRAGRGGPAGLLGRAGPAADLGHRADRDAGLVQPAVREVVRRRQAQRRVQLRRPPCRGRATATGSPSTSRASPATAAPSPMPSSRTRCPRPPTP